MGREGREGSRHVRIQAQTFFITSLEVEVAVAVVGEDVVVVSAPLSFAEASCPTLSVVAAAVGQVGSLLLLFCTGSAAFSTLTSSLVVRTAPDVSAGTAVILLLLPREQNQLRILSFLLL